MSTPSDNLVLLPFITGQKVKLKDHDEITGRIWSINITGKNITFNVAWINESGYRCEGWFNQQELEPTT
jgi:hypothetical protein